MQEFFLSPLFALPSTNPVVVGNSDTGQTTCLANIRTPLDAIRIDEQHALAIAQSSRVYQTKIVGRQVQYTGFSLGFKTDSTCGITNVTVDLNFVLDSRETLLVSEDPGLLTVLATYTILTPPFAATAAPSNLASGYEFANPSGTSNPMYESEGVYHQYPVSDPSSGFCNNPPNNCLVLAWASLQNTASGSNGIAQAGTYGYVYYSSGSPQTSYSMWTEFYPTQPNIQYCSQSSNISPTNTILADSYNHAENAGNSQTYDITVYDSTTAAGCTQTNYIFSAMGVSYYAGMIAEQPQGFELPKFIDFTITGTLYYNGGFNGIQSPYNANAFLQYSMILNGNQEAYATSVTNGFFTEHWVRSV